jgi:hypothetical protein
MGTCTMHKIVKLHRLKHSGNSSVGKLTWRALGFNNKNVEMKNTGEKSYLIIH